MRAILYTAIRCCFATHSFTLPYNGTFRPGPPSALHIIYLSISSATFIRHPVFVFLLEISADNGQTILFEKSILPYFSFQHRIRNKEKIDFVLPLISSSPMFPLPTCRFRSTPRTILSCCDTVSINLSRSCQKSFFFFMLLPTSGAYALTIFSTDHFTSSFTAISLSDTLFTSKTHSTNFSLTTIPIPFLLPSSPL